jgi:hypothetical protein
MNNCEEFTSILAPIRKDIQMHLIVGKGKAKAIPLQAWTGP